LVAVPISRRKKRKKGERVSGEGKRGVKMRKKWGKSEPI
jgi:hypothetical protein